MDFPALYDGAEEASSAAQAEYLRLIKSEYGLLFIAAVLSMQPFSSVPFLIVYALIFIASGAIMLFRTLQKPDQDWYKSRALAESIKTSTWRYAMRAYPFTTVGQAARDEFRRFLAAILESNRHIGHRIAPVDPAAQQITPEMETTRDLPLADRKALYLSDRIRDQRTWYSRKAGYNKKCMRLWIWVCAAIYVAAAVSVLSRISNPDWVLPTEPLIVAASSIIGWMQIRKFSELSSAYTLTAHEIGIIEGRLAEADTEDKFSDFVNEAELAFSREHTQWVARQQQG